MVYIGIGNITTYIHIIQMSMNVYQYYRIVSQIFTIYLILFIVFLLRLHTIIDTKNILTIFCCLRN